MPKIINLARERKRRSKDAAKRGATASAAAHGRSKAERALADSDAKRTERTLDQARRDRAHLKSDGAGDPERSDPRPNEGLERGDDV